MIAAEDAGRYRDALGVMPPGGLPDSFLTGSDPATALKQLVQRFAKGRGPFTTAEASERFGRAYLDKESDPILEMDVDLDDGGLSPDLFVDNLEFWTSVMPKFEKHIGYSK